MSKIQKCEDCEFYQLSSTIGSKKPIWHCQNGYSPHNGYDGNCVENSKIAHEEQYKNDPICHKILGTRQEFTASEWASYCSIHSAREVVYSIDKFNYNFNNTCLNPENTVSINFGMYLSADVYVFLTAKNRWMFACGLQLPTSGYYSPCCYTPNKESYETKDEATIEGIKEMILYAENKSNTPSERNKKLVSSLKKELEKRKYVQLELF